MRVGVSAWIRSNRYAEPQPNSDVGAPCVAVKANMEKQTFPKPHGVPESFYSEFGQHVTAVLSGFAPIRPHADTPIRPHADTVLPKPPFRS